MELFIYFVLCTNTALAGEISDHLLGAYEMNKPPNLNTKVFVQKNPNIITLHQNGERPLIFDYKEGPENSVYLSFANKTVGIGECDSNKCMFKIEIKSPLQKETHYELMFFRNDQIENKINLLESGSK